MTVPLSDREQQILAEIEKGLYKEDPAFARGYRKSAPRMEELRRLRIGAVTFATGFALLLAFFVTSAVLLGLAAFGAMVGGIVLIAGAMRSIAQSRTRGPSPRERAQQYLSQLEERLRERYKRT